MDYLHEMPGHFETQSLSGIRECLESGVNPNDSVNGRRLIIELINMYSRGPLFKEEVKLLVDYGLEFDDNILLAVFLDDAHALDTELKKTPDAVSRKYSFDCTFTPLYEATLLHICAEYNHLACAKILVKHGLDINAKAGLDENGFGGHTPIFHTVNQHQNKSIDTLKWLVSLKADLGLTVKGLIWGKGYPWETYVPSVNPISYAMMGLLRQFQRTEPQIYEVVSILMKAVYDSDYKPGNIPNKYLNS